jgi:adenylate cyclase
VRILSEHVAGLDLHLDLDQIDASETDRIRAALLEALSALDEKRGQKDEGPAPAA